MQRTNRSKSPFAGTAKQTPTAHGTPEKVSKTVRWSQPLEEREPPQSELDVAWGTILPIAGPHSDTLLAHKCTSIENPQRLRDGGAQGRRTQEEETVNLRLRLQYNLNVADKTGTARPRSRRRRRTTRGNLSIATPRENFEDVKDTERSGRTGRAGKRQRNKR